jgi:hypothetical protein
MDNTTSKTTTEPRRHTAACHCGAVTFAVELGGDLVGSRCNCSICARTAVTSALVKPAAFALLSGEGNLSTYEWGAKTSKRYFCKTCGVHCFGRGYLEQVGGDYVAVNLNCVDDIDPCQIALVHWDGRNNNWGAGPRDRPYPFQPA